MSDIRDEAIERSKTRRMTIFAQPMITRDLEHPACEMCGKPDGMEVVADESGWEAICENKEGDEVWAAFDPEGMVTDRQRMSDVDDGDMWLLLLPFNRAKYASVDTYYRGSGMMVLCDECGRGYQPGDGRQQDMWGAT